MQVQIVWSLTCMLPFKCIKYRFLTLLLNQKFVLSIRSYCPTSCSHIQKKKKKIVLMLNIKLHFCNNWSLVYIFLKVGPASCKMVILLQHFFCW